MENKQFDQYSAKIKVLLDNQPNHKDALELYALYKQATVGDINTERPGFFNFRGKEKWDSWNKKKGLSKKDAQSEYLDLSKKLLSENSEIVSKAEFIKDIIPQAPLDVIKNDLKITNNVNETITRLLDGTVYFVSENIKPEKTSKSNEDKTETKNESSNKKEEEEKNKINIDEDLTRKLTTQSPMSYSTKASVFESNPAQRMKSYQERKQKLIEIARAHYIEKHSLNK